MRTLQVLWATLKRELLGYFCSATSYLVLALFTLVQGYSFFLLCQALASRQAATGAALQYFFGGTFLYWLFLMFVVSVLTMRLVAEERQQGTLEPLLTAPVSEGSIVTGKYVAALVFYAFLWLPTLAFPALLQRYAADAGALDLGPVASGYLGTLLCGASAVGIGLLCSSLSRTQLLSAALSFVLLTMLLLCGLLADLYAKSDGVRQVFSYVNLFTHMDEFGRGVVDSRRVVFHLSVAALTVVLSGRILRRRPGDVGAGLRLVVEAGLLLSLVIGINVLASRHPQRSDWTRSQVYALSPRTQLLLTELAVGSQVVQVTVLSPQSGERNELSEHLAELLQRAERAALGKLRVQRLDVDRDREQVRLVGDRFHVERDDLKQGVVIVECQGRSKLIARHELGEFERGDSALGSEPPLRTFLGESALLSAIVSVTAGHSPTVCFVRGHGEPEHDSMTGSGLSDFSSALVRENFQVRLVSSLGAQSEVDAICDVVAVVGPERALLTDEAAALSRYVDRGGRLLLLLGALIDRGVTRFLDTGLEPLLLRTGIRLGQAVVSDPEHRVGTSLALVVEQTYQEHPATAALMGKRTVWPLARPVHAQPATGFSSKELITTSEKGFAETDLAAIREGQLQPTAGSDEAGAIPLLVVSEAQGAEPRGRVAVVGSSQLAWNDSLVLWNRDLLLTVTQWLADVQVKVGVAGKQPEQLHLVLQEADQNRLFFLLLVGLPLMTALLGLGVFWLRRS